MSKVSKVGKVGGWVKLRVPLVLVVACGVVVVAVASAVCMCVCVCVCVSYELPLQTHYSHNPLSHSIISTYQRMSLGMNRA